MKLDIEWVYTPRKSIDKVVIVLAYNRVEWAFRSLASLNENLPSDVDVLFVDNHSSDNLAIELREQFPQFFSIRTAYNAGFAGGNNIAARFAIANGAKLLYFLNDDTVTLPSFWEECEYFVTNQNVALVGSIVLKMDNPTIMQEAGVRFNGKQLQASYRGVDQVYTAEFAGYYSCDAICGAGFMVTADVFEQLSGFDEAFFLLCEDTDLCLRARKLGMGVGIAGKSLILHKEAESRGKVSALSYYYLTRNHVWLRRRHIWDINQRSISIFRFLTRMTLSAIYQAMKARDFKIVVAELRGAWDGVSRKHI